MVPAGAEWNGMVRVGKLVEHNTLQASLWPRVENASKHPHLQASKHLVYACNLWPGAAAASTNCCAQVVAL